MLNMWGDYILGYVKALNMLELFWYIKSGFSTKEYFYE
jgi:hypothetical protein